MDSRLIGEVVEVRIYAERIEVWYGQKQIHRLPRLSGHGKYYINYRYIIDSLVRKPGAFENYRYREELFPTSYFRMAYDLLRKQDRSAGSQRISEDPVPGRQGERERGQ